MFIGHEQFQSSDQFTRSLMEFHQVTEIFPLMGEPEFAALCEDIRLNGLREAVLTFDGQIIDGRNRFLACRKLGIEPFYQSYEGAPEHLRSFVISLNLHRRHLSESQRAMIAAKLANMPQGKRTDLVEISTMLSQTQAAQLLNISRESVVSASAVKNDGIPELSQKVEAGELSVSAASKIAKLPKAEQVRVVAKGRGKILQTAAHLHAARKLQNATATREICLVCNPRLEATNGNFIAFLDAAAEFLPRFRRYIDPIINEIIETEMAEVVRADREKILRALELGYREFQDIQKFTAIRHRVLRYELDLLVELKLLFTDVQGGGTATARGARKVLYFRREKQLAADI